MPWAHATISTKERSRGVIIAGGSCGSGGNGAGGSSGSSSSATAVFVGEPVAFYKLPSGGSSRGGTYEQQSGTWLLHTRPVGLRLLLLSLWLWLSPETCNSIQPRVAATVAAAAAMKAVQAERLLGSNGLWLLARVA